MREHARIEVESVQQANVLSAYLVARGLKTRVDRSVAGNVAVVVSKPLLRTGRGFVQRLTLMVDGWLSDGHAERATLDWKGETCVLGRFA
jgi:hypothetical protein